MLRCRDLSVTSIVRVHSSGHFLLAENEHAHYNYYDRVAVRKRKTFVCAASYDFPWLVFPTMSRLKLKLCKCCKHVFQSKRKAEYSLSDQATKRMRVSKATKRASETSEQTLLISGTTHAQFAEGLHFSAFYWNMYFIQYRNTHTLGFDFIVHGVCI